MYLDSKRSCMNIHIHHVFFSTLCYLLYLGNQLREYGVSIFSVFSLVVSIGGTTNRQLLPNLPRERLYFVQIYFQSKFSMNQTFFRWSQVSYTIKYDNEQFLNPNQSLLINRMHFYLLFRYLSFVVFFASVEFSCAVLNGDVLYVEVVVKYADFDELYPFQGHNLLLMVVCKMTEII